MSGRSAMAGHRFDPTILREYDIRVSQPRALGHQPDQKGGAGQWLAQRFQNSLI